MYCVQGSDALRPGSTPAGKQNPDTFASSVIVVVVSLLSELSVPWENDQPWGGCVLLPGRPKLGGTGSSGGGGNEGVVDDDDG